MIFKKCTHKQIINKDYIKLYISNKVKCMNKIKLIQSKSK